MVEHTTSKDDDTEGKDVINRRSYLKLAGAAVGSSLAAKTITRGATAAASGDYDTIEVSAGETRRIDIGTGETFENTIVDITADSANVQIRANGENWTMRNVAIKGSPPPKPEGGNAMMVCYDTGGDSVIEHCWFGDGSGGGTWDNAMAGVFVHARHAGTLTVRDCYFRGWLNNALYASPPGNRENEYFSGGNIGQGGEVYAENCYFEDNNVASIRMGSSGSYAKDCVVNGGDHRGCWTYYENVDFINVDSTAARAFEAGGLSHDHQGSAVANLENCQADGDLRTKGGAEINGSPGQNPRTSPQDGVPLTAEESASGGSSSSSDSGTTPSQNPDQSDSQQGTLLELIAGPGTSNVSYEFTVEGNVSKQLSGSNASENNDSVVTNDDGSVTVSGVAGNGYGDSYLVDGTVTSMNLNESKWTIRYDGSEVSKADLVLPNTLVIDGSMVSGQVCDYTFSVTGNVAKDPTVGTVDDHDTISGSQVSGRVTDGKDAYRFSGDVVNFKFSGDAKVNIDDSS